MFKHESIIYREPTVEEIQWCHDNNFEYIISERLVDAQGYSPDDLDMGYITVTTFIDKSVKNKSKLYTVVDIISILVLYITFKFFKLIGGAK